MEHSCTSEASATVTQWNTYLLLMPDLEQYPEEMAYKEWSPDLINQVLVHAQPSTYDTHLVYPFPRGTGECINLPFRAL